MNAIRIRRKIESETMTLPELKPMVGKEVEIIVLEEVAPAPNTGVRDLTPLDEMAARGGFDFDAFEQLRERSRI